MASENKARILNFEDSYGEVNKTVEWDFSNPFETEDNGGKIMRQLGDSYYLTLTTKGGKVNLFKFSDFDLNLEAAYEIFELDSNNFQRAL